MFTKEILDQSNIIAYVDHNGIYQYVNSVWQERTGISYAEAVGKSTGELMKGSGAVSAMKTGRTISGIKYYTMASGKTFSAAVRYRPVKDRSGTVCGCMIESIFDNLGEAAVFSGALKDHRKKEDVLKRSSSSGKTKYSVDDIIGESSAILRLKEQIYIASETSATVLIEGETGTGKELVAHAIHELSARSSFPFIRVNCSAIPENLMESEFFGYEEGSFTGGAKGGKEGKFQAANHGSLFLDEINAMQLTMQPKLLRALQEKEIEKVGGTKSIAVDDRIIAASNAPLEILVDEGKFRQDLYYRLNIIHIVIPPLHEREEDVLILSRHFIDRYNRELNRNITGIAKEAEEYLLRHPWPGNVRELQNHIERAMISCRGEELTLGDFAKFGRMSGIHTAAEPVGCTPVRAGSQSAGADDRLEKMQKGQDKQDTLRGRKEETEKEAIIHALEISRGNKSKAAEYLNISRTLLYRKIKKYNL